MYKISIQNKNKGEALLKNSSDSNMYSAVCKEIYLEIYELDSTFQVSSM